MAGASSDNATTLCMPVVPQLRPDNAPHISKFNVDIPEPSKPGGLNVKLWNGCGKLWNIDGKLWTL